MAVSLPQLWQRAIRRGIYDARIPATLGLSQGDGGYLFEGSKPGRIWAVREDSNTPVEVLNQTVPSAPKRVWLDVNESGELYVVGYRSQDEEGIGFADIHSRRIGTGNEDLIEMRRLEFALIYPDNDTDLTIRVSPFIYEWEGDWHPCIGGTVPNATIAALVPATAGTKCYCAVSLNPRTGAFEVNASGAVSIVTALGLADLTSITLGEDAIPLGAVELQEGQTTYQEATAWADGHLWISRRMNAIRADWLARVATTLTLSSGAVTATQGHHMIAAESGTTDDLATLNGLVAGQFYLLRADTGDTITVKHGSDNISLSGAADIALSGNKTLLLWSPDGSNAVDVSAGDGYTSKNLFDANTILKADADNTPLALVVDEQRLVGRVTGGVITALTGAQVKTMLAIDHGADQTGLGDDDHGQYALLAGRSGGQTLYGGIAANDDLTLLSTSDGTGGTVIIKGKATQTDSITEIQDASANVLFKIVSDGKITGTIYDAGTNTSPSIFTFSHVTSGTAADNFGVTFSFNLESAAGVQRAASTWNTTWATAADATRKGRFLLRVYDTAAREGLRIDTDGSQALLGLGSGGTRANTIVSVISPDTGYLCLLLKGSAGQTANLQQWQDSSANVLNYIAADGSAVFNEPGSGTATFRIESDTYPYCFYVSTIDKVYLGNASSVPTPATLLEMEEILTISGGVTDGYAAALTLDPGYTAATAQTVIRHNYIDVQDVSAAGAGPAAVTDACMLRFDANAGTHKATVGATTKSTPGGVDAWIKINMNGTVMYIPAYLSTTA